MPREECFRSRHGDTEAHSTHQTFLNQSKKQDFCFPTGPYCFKSASVSLCLGRPFFIAVLSITVFFTTEARRHGGAFDASSLFLNQSKNKIFVWRQGRTASKAPPCLRASVVRRIFYD